MTETQRMLMRAVTGTIPELKAMLAEIEHTLGTTNEDWKWQLNMLHVRGAVIAIGNARWGTAW